MEYSVLTGARVLVSTDGNRTLAVDMGDGSPIVPITPPVLDLHALGFEPMDVATGIPQYVEMDTTEVMTMIRQGPILLRGDVKLEENFTLHTDTIVGGAYGTTEGEGMCLLTIPLYFNKIYHIVLVIYPNSISALAYRPSI